MADFTRMLQLVKRAAVEAVEATKPVAVVYGRVLSISPLVVQLDQKIPLDSTHLIIPLHIADTFNVGNKLVLQRVQGGQKYVIMGVIG